MRAPPVRRTREARLYATPDRSGIPLEDANTVTLTFYGLDQGTAWLTRDGACGPEPANLPELVAGSAMPQAADPNPTIGVADFSQDACIRSTRTGSVIFRVAEEGEFAVCYLPRGGCPLFLVEHS